MTIESIESRLNGRLLKAKLRSTPPKEHKSVIADSAERFMNDYSTTVQGFDTFAVAMGEEPLVLKEVEDPILGSGQLTARLGYEEDDTDGYNDKRLRDIGSYVTKFAFENEDISKTLEVRKFKLVKWVHTQIYMDLPNPARDWPFEPVFSYVVSGGKLYNLSRSKTKPVDMLLTAEKEHRENIIQGQDTLATLRSAPPDLERIRARFAAVNEREKMADLRGLLTSISLGKENQ
jgi:hypothetical protein